MKMQPLLEKIEITFTSPYDLSRNVNVFKNPNYFEMNAARSKTAFNELRGIVYNKNIVYVWDANLATHDDVVKILALPEGAIWRFIIDGDDVITNADQTASDNDIASSSMIVRMLKR